MPVSVDWVTGVITIPQSYMTLVGSVYELGVDQLRKDLNGLADDPDEGMAWTDTHKHVTENAVGGIVIARAVRFLSPYTITITPAGAWQVLCVGANHNIQDVYNNLTGPTLLPNLSAGLIVAETGVSGLTPAESQALLDIDANLDVITASIILIEDDIATIQTDLGFVVVEMTLAKKILQNRKETDPDTGIMTVYDDDDVTPLFTAQIFEDVGGTQAYRGRGLERQERLV